MKDITNQIQTYYRYNGNFYVPSSRKDFHMNDVFLDCRDYSAKIIKDEQDIIDMSYVAPEIYVILEEATI